MRISAYKLRMPSKEQALPGRAEAMPVDEKHFVLKTRILHISITPSSLASAASSQRSSAPPRKSEVKVLRGSEM